MRPLIRYLLFLGQDMNLLFNITYFKLILMGNFFTSSIGKKVLMAAMGLFLIVFLLVHLGINSLLVFSADTKNLTLRHISWARILSLKYSR